MVSFPTDTIRVMADSFVLASGKIQEFTTAYTKGEVLSETGATEPPYGGKVPPSPVSLSTEGQS